MRAIGLLITLALTLPGAALAQTTPSGDPDLQGVWSNQTPIPLERPAALANEPRDRTLDPLDRRPPLGARIQQWHGDSRGWWEGKTLVVETTNFNDKRLF